MYANTARVASEREPQERKPSARAQLLARIRQLNKRHGPVIGTAKYGKPVSRLTVTEMEAAIAEWETTIAACPRTANWQDIPIGSKFVAVSGDGTIWTAYLGFYTSQEAGRWLELLLREEHCKFAIVREGSRCRQPFEIKAWQPSSELFEAMQRGTLRSLQPRRIELDAADIEAIEADIDRF